MKLIPFPVFSIDKNHHRLTPLNRRAYELLQEIPFDSNVNICHFRLFHSPNLCNFCLFTGKGNKPGEGVAVEVPVDSSPLPETLSFQLFQQFDERGNIIEILVNDSRRLEAQQQKERRGKNAMLKRLVQSIAHDLNNPLTGASLLLENLGNELSLNEKHTHHLQLAIQEIIRAQKMVHELLSTNNSLASEQFEYDLKDLLGSLINDLKETHSSLNVKFSCDILSDCRATANREQLIRVFENLMNNSVECYERTKPGHDLTIWIHLRRSHRKPGFAEIQYVDNAGGIQTDNIDSVFDPYFTTKHHGGKHGLGLFNVQRILQRHNAEISVSSRSYYVRFSILFPLI